MARLHTCTIDSIEEHLLSLRSRIETAKRELSAIKDERKNAPTRRKLTALTRRMLQISEPLKEIKALESRARKKLSALAAHQESARAKLATTAMTKKEFLSLPFDERMQHTLWTLANSDHTGTRTAMLKFFLRTVEESDKLFPASSRIANSQNLNLGRRNAESWARSEGFRYDFDPLADRHSFTDQRAGVGDGSRSVSARTFEEAALKLDDLYQARMLEGSFDPPGAVGIDTLGPNAPQLAPLGRLRSDGTRVDLSGDVKNIVAPEPSKRSFASFGRFEGLWHKHASHTSAFLSKLYHEGKRLFGKDWDGSRFFQSHYVATQATEESHRVINSFLRQAYDLARKRNLSFDRKVGVRLNPAAVWLDKRAEMIFAEAKRAGATSDAARDLVARALPNLDAEASSKFGLSSNEIGFLQDMRSWWESVADFLEVSPDERRLAYLTRAQRWLESYTESGDPLQTDATMKSFFGTKIRRRVEPMEIEDPILREIYRSLEDADAQEAQHFATSDSYFDKVLMYTNSGIRRKVAGEQIDNFIRSIGYTTPEVNAAVAGIDGVALGNMQVHAWVADRMKLEVRRLLGQQSKADTLDTSRRRDALLNRADSRSRWAERVEELSSHVGANPVSDLAVNALKSWSDRLRIKASEPHIRGWFDIYGRLYRAKTFGFSAMAPVRDFTSLAFLAGVRFKTRDFAEVGSKLFFNPREFMRELKRQQDLGWTRSLDDVIQMAEIGRQQPVSPTLKQIAQDLRAGKLPDLDLDGWLDFTQLAYRSSELAQHVFVNRLSEIATERAFKTYSSARKINPQDRSRALDRFLLDTGVAYSTEAWSDVTKLELENALLSGNKRSLVEVVQRINRIETNTLFHRWNASPYVETGIGRGFMQFGSWSMGLISSMSHTITGPWRNLSDPRMRRLASAQVAARWALGAEAVYSLGAAFDIDTSDWIPFFHNGLFFGGPALNMTEDVRALFAGDPAMMQRWEKNPSGVALGLARQALPIIPSAFQRQLGQFYGPDGSTFYESFVGPSPRLRETYHRWTFSLGFHPFTESPYPTFRRSGISGALLADTLGVTQDRLSALTGGALAPGTAAQSKRFDPALAP